MMKRTRNVPVLFWVSSQEMELIRQKMAQLGTDSPSMYLRKMTIDGYVLQLDSPELRELASLLCRSNNNLNQLARRVYGTGRFYGAGLEDLRQGYERLWSAAGHVLSQLSKLQ